MYHRIAALTIAAVFWTTAPAPSPRVAPERSDVSAALEQAASMANWQTEAADFYRRHSRRADAWTEFSAQTRQNAARLRSAALQSSRRTALRASKLTAQRWSHWTGMVAVSVWLATPSGTVARFRRPKSTTATDSA